MLYLIDSDKTENSISANTTANTYNSHCTYNRQTSLAEYGLLLMQIEVKYSIIYIV